jgi:hypothetical protein
MALEMKVPGRQRGGESCEEGSQPHKCFLNGVEIIMGQYQWSWKMRPGAGTQFQGSTGSTAHPGAWAGCR